MDRRTAAGARFACRPRPPTAAALLGALVLLTWFEGGPARGNTGLDASDAATRACDLGAEADALRLSFEREASHGALAAYRAALEIWTALDERREAADSYSNIGRVHEQLGDLEQALESYELALDLAREAGDSARESDSLSAVGLARVLLGDLEAGREACDRALVLARELGHLPGEAEALTCLGEVEYHHGDFAAALTFHQLGAGRWQAVGDARGHATSLMYLGSAAADLGEHEKSNGYHRQALAIWRALGDRRGEAFTLSGLARLHYLRAEYQTALNSFSEALLLVAPSGDRVWLASTLSGSAAVYFEMGQHRAAADTWRQALVQFREAGVRMAEADVLFCIGQSSLALGDHAAALSNFREALVLSEELDNLRFTSLALRLIGLTELARGDATESIRYFERALSIRGTGGDPKYEAYTMADLASAYAALGDHEPALRNFDRALELSRQAGDRLGEANGLFGLASIAAAQDDLAGARHRVEQALGHVESLRIEVASRELRASYLASVHHYYRLYIEILMRLHDAQPGAGFDGLAFEASERARARALLESLGKAGVDIRGDVDEELQARERLCQRALREATDRLMRSPGGGSDGARAALDREIRELTIRCERLQAEMRSRSPRYASLAESQPFGLAEIQAQVLDEETVLLEYALGEERSFLWAVSSDGYSSHQLASGAELEARAGEVYELLTARLSAEGVDLAAHRRRVADADAAYRGAVAEFSELILAPVAHLVANKRLLVVTDGALRHLPFAALVLPGDTASRAPLVSDHEIVHLPSASMLGVLRRKTNGRKPSPGTVAVLADPVFELDDPRVTAVPSRPDRAATRSSGSDALPARSEAHRALRDVGFLRDGGSRIPRLLSTRREAEAIVASALPGASLLATDFDANLETATSDALSEYRIVHFATHGLVNGDNPGLSGILLSLVDEQGEPRSGFLRLHDIYELDLPADLVVLSACSTALGRNLRGEGLVGIVRGFMYSGAERVVASLWKVDDRATGELMSRFYRFMLGAGRSPAAALRQAQLEMRAQPRWSAPFYWAGFVLQGEYR